MKDVFPNLYVGTVVEANLVLKQPDDWRLANVAKTLHCNLNGWSMTGKYSNHPFYIIREEPAFISVNWVDGPASYFNYQNKGVSVVKQLLAFIQKSLEKEKKVLITCDQGRSRSPSVALLYLAKVSRTITDASYIEASREFKSKYPDYQPAPGISGFLTSIWGEI
jgi:hypothetical protein